MENKEDLDKWNKNLLRVCFLNLLWKNKTLPNATEADNKLKIFCSFYCWGGASREPVFSQEQRRKNKQRKPIALTLMELTL